MFEQLVLRACRFITFLCVFFVQYTSIKLRPKVRNVLVVDHFRMIGLCYSLVFRYHR
jgi:hypothetical protein